jgi:hypothetical protein
MNRRTKKLPPLRVGVGGGGSTRRRMWARISH